MPGQAFISDKSGSGILLEPPFALFPEFTPVPPFSVLRSSVLRSLFSAPRSPLLVLRSSFSAPRSPLPVLPFSVPPCFPSFPFIPRL